MNHLAGRMLRYATAAALGLAALMLAASLVLVCLPEKPARALIGPDGWTSTAGFFANSQPKRGDVRDSIFESKDVMYWRSWSPETNATRGTVMTLPFPAPKYLAVPYGGFAGNPGIAFYLACGADGRRMPLATAMTMSRWTETVVRIPAGWCAKDVQVVAHTSSRKDYIEIGTPYKLGFASFFKQTALGQLLPFLLSFGIVAGSVLALAWLSTRLALARSPVTGGIAGLGVLGMALFFLFYASHSIAYATSVAIALAGLGTLAWASPPFVRRRAAQGHFHDAAGVWMELLLLWLLVALFMFFLAHMLVSGTGPWEPNGRFSPARWSTDNQIPMLIAEHLFLGQDLATLDIQPWKVSDRPPLLYGLLAMLRVPAALTMQASDGQYAFYQAYLHAGIILNTLWVPVVAFIARRCGLSFARQAVIVAVLALTPFALFNSIYIWPKLLGGAFGLLAFWVLADYDPAHGFNRFTGSPRPFTEAALLCALALMSHGGTFFGVLALACWIPRVRGLPPWRPVLAGIAVAATVLLPWSLWQHFVQPPGNTLIKLAFANTFGFDEPDKSLLVAILDAYQNLGALGWLEIKRDALMALTMGLPSTCGLGGMVSLSGVGSLATQRAVDLLYFGPSLRFLLAGFCVAPFVFLRRKRLGQREASLTLALSLLALGLLGLLFNALTTLNCFINHHQSYQSILQIMLGLVLLLLPSGRYARLALMLSACYAIAIWIVQPLYEIHVRTDVPALLGMLLVACLYALSALGHLRPTSVHAGGAAQGALLP